ncbi:proline-, glutamic acid/leucine-rich protein isoform X2 [Tasmannia lanceolata]|uniref:proline-, glutamic acid/leucine-rich protein isoform X2 n=1 Tax=Tasmannia lanceolata TaxID=3420 RepID=UPI004063392A
MQNDKCWAGICLLGVTSQECCSNRFLASYPLWLQKLLSQIQPPSDSHFVKVASCASLSDLFTRLGGFSSVKKDATSHAVRLIPSVLKLLTEDGSETVWEGSVDLLCTLISFFPSSIHRHYDSIEAGVVSKIMSGKCSARMSKKLAQCLALLPKARGDDDSWSIMMHKMLISINGHLNDAFQGLEEETKSAEAIRLLVPQGKDPPPPLGGQIMSIETSVPSTAWFEQLIMPRVSTLMQCCCMMLTNPYPVQVTVPVYPLLALVRRVLLVDGSPCHALMPFLTVLQQEFVCAELPVLHLCSLDLLIAVIKAVRSQLLPHAADVVRLLTEYFRRCMLPSVRIKVYSIMQILLISMGVGMALYLAQEVITNAFADLHFVIHGNDSTSNQYLKVVNEALQQSGRRKRKHGSVSSVEHQNGVAVEVEVLNNKPTTPVSVQIAALQALEALVTVGGALRSECWRSDVDHLLITVATNACDAGWPNEDKRISLSDEPNTSRAEFQLAALRALLASLLSPARVRPPYLSQGLELFRRGKQEAGTKLAEFCAHALLALEVLIHPRALPLSEFPAGNYSTLDEGHKRRFPDNIFSSSHKPSTPFSRGVDDFDPDDDLYESWLGNGEETGADTSEPQDKQIENANGPAEKDVRPVIEVPPSEKLCSDVSNGAEALVEGTEGPNNSINMEIVGANRDENMVDSEQLEVPVSNNGDRVLSGNGVKSCAGVLSTNSVILSPSDVSNPKKCSSVSAGVLPVSDKGKGLMYGSDSDSQYSLPDIVDGDPDSD